MISILQRIVEGHARVLAGREQKSMNANVNREMRSAEANQSTAMNILTLHMLAGRMIERQGGSYFSHTLNLLCRALRMAEKLPLLARNLGCEEHGCVTR